MKTEQCFSHVYFEKWKLGRLSWCIFSWPVLENKAVKKCKQSCLLGLKRGLNWRGTCRGTKAPWQLSWAPSLLPQPRGLCFGCESCLSIVDYTLQRLEVENICKVGRGRNSKSLTVRAVSPGTESAWGGVQEGIFLYRLWIVRHSWGKSKDWINKAQGQNVILFS